MVPGGPAAEAGLLSYLVLPPRETHRDVGQCGLRPSVGAAWRCTGGAGTQRFPSPEGLRLMPLERLDDLELRTNGPSAAMFGRKYQCLLNSCINPVNCIDWSDVANSLFTLFLNVDVI